MRFVRLLLLAFAFSTVATLAGCGDDDYSSDGSTTTQQDLSGAVVDMSRAD